MHVVGDLSFSRYPAAVVRGAGFEGLLSYTGTARFTLDELRDVLNAGLSFGFIQESYSTRATEGYGAGVEDARYAEARVNELLDALGFPRTDEILYVVSDGNASQPGTPAELAGIAEYSRAVGDVSERSRFRVYGNTRCVDAARSGSPKCVGTMVPDTWGARSGIDDLWQMANVATPLDGIDVDHAFVDDWGQFPRPNGGGVIKSKGAEHAMWIAVNNHDQPGTPFRAMFVGGDCKIDDCVGAPGLFSFPQDALDAHGRGVELKPVTNAKWQEILDRTVSYAAIESALAGLPAAVAKAVGGAPGGGVSGTVSVSGQLQVT